MTTTETVSFSITRECTNCGRSFSTDNPQQTKCRRSCRSSESRNGARRIAREVNYRHFIGVDGEGITRPNGEHLYDMLSVGSETLVSRDGSHLHYEEIFTFLYDQYLENPNSTFVGFFLGYDFNQWFRTLPENRASMLLTKAGRIARKRKTNEYLGPFPVNDGKWEFDILGMKRFRLRPLGSETGWMYINDAGGFFQTSFLNVIDPKQWDEPIVTPEEYAIILEGKKDRGRRMTLAEQMQNRSITAQYNTLENEVLARVMTRLNEGFTKIGVKLSKDQWYGPGQAAQAWMRMEGIPSSKEIVEVTPEWAWQAAQDSYFGGWFEIFAHGHIPGTSYEYDINSAYPYVISTLPCLLHGDWSKGEGKPPVKKNAYTLVYAMVAGDDPICGAMLHRTSKKRICRPSVTKGWYWLHELEMAQRAGVVNKIVWYSWVQYDPCDCRSPYAVNMPTLYKQRLRVGKNSPEGKAYKLIYNSAYGKHAQSIGSPRFANAIYASLITAGCRTQILYAISTHPTRTKSLLMVATDGIYFREQHPSLEISPTTLGKWDYAEKQNLTLFMPGLYWDDSTRDRLAKGESPKLKSRGISAGDLATRITFLDSSFYALSALGEWPKVDIPINFQMISAVQALVRNKWELAGTLIDDDIKSISANPHTKRRDEPYIDGDIVRTPHYDIGGEIESVPYDKTFGRGDSEDDLGISPDGDISKILYEMVSPE